MTLWKLRFALEYCRKSRGISKDNAKTMIFNAYRESKLHILIRKHWRRFVIHKPIPLIWICQRGMVFDEHLNLINLG